MSITKSQWPNHYGETFWRLQVPKEHAAGGLEIGVVANEEGIEFGGELIPWAEIEEAKTTATDRANEQ